MKKLFFTLTLAAFFFIQKTEAQIDLQQKLVLDSKTVIGKLPNGITYYLRHNEEPKNRASFYIIRNAGALLENDDQDGLAHFLEHMAFQGTKNFPGKGIISGLEKHGVAFGKNINAYTAQNETVYNLSQVPTNLESVVDTCLLILHDWSYYLTLDDHEIDEERGVITEEWRTRRTPDFRLRIQTTPVLFKGSKYAVRDVIGSLDVINHFKYQTIRDFYHKWYRTDLEAIAIVGDIDVKVIEEKVKKLFSSIPAVQHPAERPFFSIPDDEETNYVLATDKEVTRTSLSMSIRFPNKFNGEEKNSVAYAKDALLNSFYNTMMATRIGEIMQKGEPPFMGGSIGVGGLVRGYYTYNINVSPKPNEEATAWEAILRENERVLRYGFTESELERVKTNTLAGLETSYIQRDKINNESLCNEIKSHFLEQEPMVDFEYYYQLAKQLVPSITVDEVSAKAKEWNVTKNRVLVVAGPAEGETFLTKEEMLSIMDKVSKDNTITPYEDKVVEASLINEPLKGGTIVATRMLPQFSAVEWTLDNGARVVFRKADYEKDNIAITSYSEGGTSLYDIDMLPAAENASSIVSSFGVGDLDPVALSKVLSGKVVTSAVSISNLSESVGGSSSIKDMETMFQLLYMRFEHPRFDESMLHSMITRNKMNLAQMMGKPNKIMGDSLKMIMTNYHPRTQLFNEDYLNRITMNRLEAVYRDRIKDASDFIFFIVGNAEEEQVRPLVEKYIGSLKSEYREETWKDNQVRAPKGKVQREIPLQLETSKSTVMISFTNGKMKYNIYDDWCNKVLRGILTLRYTENVREKEGGTYGVGVNASAQRIPYPAYSMSMQFDCDPEKADHLKSLIYVETEKLMKEAPQKEELDKVVSDLIKDSEQSKHHNNYWVNVLTSYYINHIDVTNPDNMENLLHNLKPKDIQKYARKFFKKADVVDVVFKSESKQN